MPPPRSETLRGTKIVIVLTKFLPTGWAILFPENEIQYVIKE